jgi:hypothetical protein
MIGLDWDDNPGSLKHWAYCIDQDIDRCHITVDTNRIERTYGLYKTGLRIGYLGSNLD